MQELKDIQAGWQRKIPKVLQGESSEARWTYYLAEEESAIASATERGELTAVEAGRRYDGLTRLRQWLNDPVTLPQLGSPTDNFGVESSLQAFLDEAGNSARRLGAGTSRRMLVGCLPSGRINVASMPSAKSDGAIALADLGFPIAINILAKIVAQCYPAITTAAGNLSYSTAIEDIDAHVHAHDVIVRRYAEFLHAYLVDGHPAAAPRFQLADAWLPLADTLRDSAELFTMAHEFAHLSRGDVDLPLENLKGDQTFEYLMRSYATYMELEADRLGVAITIDSAQTFNVSPVRSLLGALMWINAAHVLEVGVHALHLRSVADGLKAVEDKHGEEMTSTHPSRSARISVIRSLTSFAKSLDSPAFGPELVVATMQFDENMQALEHVMSILEGFALVAFETMVKRGVALHRKWDAEMRA